MLAMEIGSVSFIFDWEKHVKALWHRTNKARPSFFANNNRLSLTIGYCNFFSIVYFQSKSIEGCGLSMVE